MLPRFTTSSSIRQRCKSLIRDNHCCRLRLIGLELLRTVRPVSKRFCVYHCFQISQSVTRLITTTGRLSLPRTLSSSITCLSSTFDLHCIYHELWSRAFAVGANLTNCENMEVVGSCSLSSSSTEYLAITCAVIGGVGILRNSPVQSFWGQLLHRKSVRSLLDLLISCIIRPIFSLPTTVDYHISTMFSDF